MRLIDADKISYSILAWMEERYKGNNEVHECLETVYKLVNDLPSVTPNIQEAFMDGYNYRDAEIVRCKDCEYWGTLSCGICWDDIVKKDADWYCKDGDRRIE